MHGLKNVREKSGKSLGILKLRISGNPANTKIYELANGADPDEVAYTEVA